MLILPEREEKKRSFGLTSISDTSLTTKAIEGLLEDYGSFIDIAKLGVGTAYIIPRLKEKIELYEKHDVEVYFGGTLFEKFYYQNKVTEYFEYLQDQGITMVEISCGTIDLPLEVRCALVQRAIEDYGFKVLAEVGSKDQEAIMAPSEWINEMNRLLEVGAAYVITEGRNSGTAGLYRPSGEIRSGLLADIISNTDTERVIFEAPSPKLQMYFINLLGSNVNLGNIEPNEVLLLETQRRGLRNETFYIV